MTDKAALSLRNTPLLAAMSDANAARLLAATRHRAIAQGERLITAGDGADELFLVLRGRFSVLSGGRLIAAIGAGEPLGEMAFFSGGVRSADVVASRSGEVLVLRRADWDALARDLPEIAQSILAVLARRLEQASRHAIPLRPLAPTCIALTGDVPEALLQPLLGALGRIGRWSALRAGAGDARATLHNMEAAGRKIVLVDPPGDLLDDVDEVFHCDSLSAPPVAGPGNARHLVLWRDRAGDAITGTTEWLALRPGVRHHHVALDRSGDIDRLARFIDGSALGLVLSGGGAQGTAHLGALKALCEGGIAFDCIGGTSAGAAMGAALALERDPDAVMDLIEDVFLRARVMGRYTIPKYSVIDAGHFDAALQRHYGAHRIEDLPLSFFAVATSLTTNDMAVLERGPLWQAVRASTSIPAIFPAWIAEAGEVLVDGALIDNAPIQAMRSRKPGPAVLLNLLRSGDWRVTGAYGDFPGRGRLMWQTFTGPLRRRVPAHLPSAIAILTRTFNVNAQRRLRSVDAPGDVMIDIAPLRDMQFLDWTRAREQFESSYRAFSGALELVDRSPDAPRDPVKRLAAVRAALPWNMVDDVGGGETPWGDG
ncbi:patatin-like phospholipase family protein [Oceaniovalibus sp. ACAM 378]|uniref:patatin-like phospholipase family protein n=1 Tax=Oceaniovalibus sp. ACAM 378 TaxID=2599923 RepID=UPI0011D301DD|nr:patatin-like phospholipase family protein [Oceaniovalibus sp. ACAM 378]TYB87636.1 cyclic nucleotide-binding domain-containing protein [Oceaniovalibus sp. ACAM 378]